jgi:hypothetical protein
MKYRRVTIGTLALAMMLAMPLTAKASETKADICNNNGFNPTQGYCGECTTSMGFTGRFIFGGQLCEPC